MRVCLESEVIVGRASPIIINRTFSRVNLLEFILITDEEEIKNVRIFYLVRL